jgi:hypothetical protein
MEVKGGRHTTFWIGQRYTQIREKRDIPDETGLVGTDSTLSRTLTVSTGAGWSVLISFRGMWSRRGKRKMSMDDESLGRIFEVKNVGVSSATSVTSSSRCGPQDQGAMAPCHERYLGDCHRHTLVTCDLVDQCVSEVSSPIRPHTKVFSIRGPEPSSSPGRKTSRGTIQKFYHAHFHGFDPYSRHLVLRLFAIFQHIPVPNIPTRAR